MSFEANTKKIFPTLRKITVLAILIAAVILSGKFADFMDLYGLAFVLLGGVATALMSFTVGEIGSAFRDAGLSFRSAAENRRSFVFWDSASRNFWMVGVLATLISFAVALTRSEGGIEGIATGMASSLIPAVYGGILGVICLVPAMKLSVDRTRDRSETMTEPSESPALSFVNVVGYVLLIILIAGTLIRAEMTATARTYQVWEWFFFYWPSLLVVLGGTLAIVVFVGDAAKGQTFTFGFSVTGLLGSLMGFIQILLGMASKSIEDIAAAVTFVLSSCFLALLGILLVGAPLEDRMLKHSVRARHSVLSRVAWYVFPLVVLIFLVITFVVVLTPMEMQM